MKTFTHGRQTIAYRDAGTGPAVVMLHNGGSSSTIWRHQMEALAPRHRVVAVDLPGFGESPRPDPPVRLPEMVELIAALIDAEGLAPALLVGNCMGTNIAASLSRGHPPLVRGILGINPLTEASFSAGRIGLLHRMQRFAPGPSRALRSGSRRLRPPRPVGRASLRFQLGRKGTALRLHHDPELVACQVRRDQLPALVDVLDDMAAYGDLDRDGLPGDIPVWVAWGGQNRVLSRGDAAHLTRLMQADRVEVFDGSGHLPMLEDPEAVTALILEFSDGLSDQASSSPTAEPREASP